MLFVRSNEGPFYLIEDRRDPLLPIKAPELREVAEGTARPVTIDGRSDDGKILTSAVIWYSNAIFIGELAVHLTGDVEMLRDEPFAADLPVKLDLPIASSLGAFVWHRALGVYSGTSSDIA